MPADGGWWAESPVGLVNTIPTRYTGMVVKKMYDVGWGTYTVYVADTYELIAV